MMAYHFDIEGQLPGLNEYVRACRANKHAGAEMKRRQEDAIGWHIQRARVPRFFTPVRLVFNWCEPNLRRDYDNVAFAKKFILDALVAQGVLKGDGPRYITGFRDEFDVDRLRPHVRVTIEEVAA